MDGMVVKKMRLRLGLSQDAFAKKLKVCKRTIQRWEANETKCKLLKEQIEVVFK